MNTENITITPVGGAPITVTVSAPGDETAAEFAARVAVLCPIHPADLPVVQWNEMGVVPTIVARRGSTHLVAYDGAGSVPMPPQFAVDARGTGWALTAALDCEALGAVAAADAVANPREGWLSRVERLSRSIDKSRVRVTVETCDGLWWGEFDIAIWLASVSDACYVAMPR